MREFEEGAWYPAYEDTDQERELFVLEYTTLRSLEMCFRYGQDYYKESDFDWIGEKLEIEWPEIT